MYLLLFQIKPKSVIKKGLKAGQSGTPWELVIPAILLLLFAIGFLIAFQYAVKGIKYKKKGPILYGISFGIVFALMGLSGMADKSEPIALFWLLMLGFLALGSLHTWFLFLLHSAWSKRDSFWPEALFSLFVTSLGSFFFILVFFLTDKQGYPMAYNLCLCAFLVPFLLVKAYDVWMNIPKKEYKGWKYPKGKSPNLRAYDPKLLHDALYVNMVLSERSIDNSYPFKVKVKVGHNYRMGPFFHVWVHEQTRVQNGYNIQYLDKDHEGTPISWLFYVMPTRWWEFKRFIDPEKTMEENRLRDGSTIVAMRVLGETFTRSAFRSIKQYSGTSGGAQSQGNERLRPRKKIIIHDSPYSGNDVPRTPPPNRGSIKINKR